MELSRALKLTVPAPPGPLVSSISTPADLKAKLTDEEYFTFCEAARTKGGFADKWFKLTPDEANTLVAPSVAARNVPPTPKPLPPSAPPAPTQAQAASEAPLSVDGACRSSNPKPSEDH